MHSNVTLPDPFGLPSFAEILPDTIDAALDRIMDAHNHAIATSLAAAPDFAAVWLPVEKAMVTIDSYWATLEHLHAVADTPELRSAYAAARAKLTAHGMAVRQNRALFETLMALDTVGATDIDRVAIDHALRDFRLAGVALEDGARARFADISIELARLANEFSSAVLDATDHWSTHITDETALAGLPETDKAMFAAAAANKGMKGWLVSLHAPSVNAVLSRAENRTLRERVYEAYNTRASDRGPDAGLFDNGARIVRILTLRREAAALLGFADPVEWKLAPRMASSGAEVLAFLRDLAARAKPAAMREVADLRDFASRELGITDLQPWDLAFVGERLRRARFAVDQQETRAYFPVEIVLAGWRDLLRKLYGIVLIAREDVELYHPDVAFFDVADDAGEVFAGLYIDLHARTGKRGGAWMAQARPLYADAQGVSRPIAYMVCNFPPNSDAVPALLTQADVTTLLHETGHVLHHLFTRIERPSIAGTNGFEWDAIELPSQAMEDFAWDRDVLTSMSGHYQTGETLPPDLHERMLGARHFLSGMTVLRQVEYALFDLLLHLAPEGADPVEIMQRVREETGVIHPPEWNRFSHAFSHIFAGGYAAGYYSYLWAEVLAADAFQRFAEAGAVVDRATGDAFRAEVLSRGASRPAAASFEAFRGRKADPAAMLMRRGLC